MHPLPFLGLDDATRELVLAFALQEADWHALGLQVLPACSCASSTRLRRMHRLHQLCHGERSNLPERMGDLLDLRFADEVARVRFLKHEELVPIVRARVAVPGRDSVGLIWALTTDGREPVRALGRWFSCELRLAALENHARTLRAGRASSLRDSAE